MFVKLFLVLLLLAALLLLLQAVFALFFGRRRPLLRFLVWRLAFSLLCFLVLVIAVKQGHLQPSGGLRHLYAPSVVKAA